MDIVKAIQSVLQHYHSGDLQKAKYFCEKIIENQPDNPEVLYFLGIIDSQLENLDSGIDYIKRSLQFNTSNADAYLALGMAFQKKGDIDDAITSYKKALQLDPAKSSIYNNLGNAFQIKGEPDMAETYYRHAVQLNPNDIAFYQNLLFVMNYNSGYNAQTIFSEHLQFAKRFEEPLLSSISTHTNERSLNRQLKIGYVSPDFRKHSVSCFIEPVLAAHNKEQFEVFCYSLVHKEDEVTKRLRGYVDHWRNIAGMSDEKAAESIRNDGIDILVDLAGHTGNNRILLFARKPAPVQVTWIGYLATTGLSSIDYHIADKYTDPPGMTEHLFSEKLLRLPESFVCYLPDKDSPGVSKLPALKAGYINFGSFNNFARISHKVISVWSKILQEVSNSRLILKAFNFYNSTTRQTIIDMFTQRGIASERIVLLPWELSPKHLESYNLVDIGLDTFPCNGGVTTCEALWMGVPVIAFAGTAYDSRVGISLLSNIGLPDLVARTPDEYISIAVNLASDLERLQSLRERLRDMMSHSPLCDAKRFIENLENAYRRIWEICCQSDQAC